MGSDTSMGQIMATVPIMIFIILMVLMFELKDLRLMVIAAISAPLGMIGCILTLVVTQKPMGFVAIIGMLAIVFLFYWIVRRCFEIGRQATSFDLLFNGLVAQGVGLWIGLQAFINLGVNLGLLPTKGLTLPFMSWGGSAIVMSCVALALVLRIDVENRRLMRGTVL